MFSCLGYRCDRLKTPFHGNISDHNITVGSTATFSCDVGYDLIGDSNVTCQSNSLWSASTPTCESKIIAKLCQETWLVEAN